MSGKLLAEDPNLKLRAGPPFTLVSEFEIEVPLGFKPEAALRQIAQDKEFKHLNPDLVGRKIAVGPHTFVPGKVYPAKICAVSPHWFVQAEDILRLHQGEAAMIVGIDGLALMGRHHKERLHKGFDYVSVAGLDNLPKSTRHGKAKVPVLRACSYEFDPEYLLHFVTRNKGFDQDQRVLLFYPPNN